VENPDITGFEVIFEEVARLLPLFPKGSIGFEHLLLAVEEALILSLENRETQVLLRPEVVVDLAERDTGLFCDGPGREAGVADIE
jgi:hypothetical protein